MSQTTTLFRIMIASPSDVKQEWQAAYEAICRWNTLNSLEKNVVLLPLRWELDAPQGIANDAQDIIDENLVNISDMVIGIFKSKLGRKSPDFLSYTVGEIKKHTDNGKQALLFYGRPSKAASTGQEAQEQRDLLKFKEDIKKNLGVDAIYRDYKSVSEFKANIYTWIERGVNAHLLPSVLASSAVNRPSFDDVVVQRTTLQHRIEEAHKSVFISGASLISTLTTNFDRCIKNDVSIRLLMTLEDKSLIERCAQLSYTTPSELQAHIQATLNHFKNMSIPRQMKIRALDAVMPVALVGIDIEEPNGKIYVQQYLYETDPATDPTYICYYGDKWFSVYCEQIRKMWRDGKSIRFR